MRTAAAPNRPVLEQPDPGEDRRHTRASRQGRRNPAWLTPAQPIAWQSPTAGMRLGVSAAEPAAVEGLQLPKQPDERVGGPHHVLRRVHDRPWQEAFRSGQGQPRRPDEARMDEILGRAGLGRPELLPPDLLVLEPLAR